MKTKTLSAMLLLLGASLCANAKSAYDLGKPFGFCTRTSRTDNAPKYAYEITGGGALSYPVTGVSSTVTLKSDGSDMRKKISDAIKNYNVIVFDGSQGDFIVSNLIELKELSNKTILGINGARLCTEWYTTQEIINALNKAGVPEMSTKKKTGGKLSNGKNVGEQAEYNTRQIIINLTGDQKEEYRNSGIFSFEQCTNLVVRNVKFSGPGSIDVGGKDLVSLQECKNVWIDHCDFSDGQDGNFDITRSSDFVTVSWCTFSYTERSYMHQNTNLVGFSDNGEPKGFLNITFANNMWGQNCRARMPMVRVGKVHVLNNYYNCPGNHTACINPRNHSEVLIEGNYFEEGVKHIFSQSDAKAWQWSATNHAGITPQSKGSITVPYEYKEIDSNLIPQEVGTYAGATLKTDEDWK